MMLGYVLHSALAQYRRSYSRTVVLLFQLTACMIILTISFCSLLETKSQAAIGERRVNVTTGKEALIWSGAYPLFSHATLRHFPVAAALYQHLGKATTRAAGKTYRLRHMAAVSKGYFEVENIEVLHGTIPTFASLQPEGMISEDTAQQLFGTAEAQGKTLTVSYGEEQSRTLTVSGVYKILPGIYKGFIPSVLVTLPEAAKTSVLAVKLNDDNSQQQVRQFLTSLYPQQDLNLERMGFLPSNGLSPTAIIFGFFGLFALLISSISVYSAATISLTEREYELSLKRILGLNQQWLLWDALAPLLILGLLAFGMGAILASGVIDVLKHYVRSDFFVYSPLKFGLYGASLASGCIAFSMVLVCGLLAVRVQSVSPLVVLRKL